MKDKRLKIETGNIRIERDFDYDIIKALHDSSKEFHAAMPRVWEDDHSILAVHYAMGELLVEETNRKKFVDVYGRYHDKECKHGIASSNNGWIYTAYAEVVGLPIDRTKLYDCFVECRPNYPQGLPINRSPGKVAPPMSRDEILGLVSLQLLWTVDLELEHWQFCNLPGFKATPLHKLNWFKVVWCLLRIAWAQLLVKVLTNPSRKIKDRAHRNVVWMDASMKPMWPLAFRLMPQDTWYLLKRSKGRKASWLHEKYAWWSMGRTVKRGDASGILILWLKLNKLNLTDHPLYKKIDIKKAVGEYFTHPAHPIKKAVLSGE